MIEIKDLLARFDHLLLQEEVKKESIRAVISKAIGVEIKSQDIKIKNNTIYLNIKSIYKNEIFLKKDQIDTLMEQALVRKTKLDIR